MSEIAWICTFICLVGTILNVKKIKLCFYLWALGNIIWFIIDIKNGLISRAILDTVQGVLAVWGIIEWRDNDD